MTVLLLTVVCSIIAAWIICKALYAAEEKNYEDEDDDQ